MKSIQTPLHLFTYIKYIKMSKKAAGLHPDSTQHKPMAVMKQTIAAKMCALET